MTFPGSLRSLGSLSLLYCSEFLFVPFRRYRFVAVLYYTVLYYVGGVGKNRSTSFSWKWESSYIFFFFFWSKYFLFIFIFHKYTEESCSAASVGCNSGPQICTLLCNWSCDGRTFHFVFIVYYDPHIIFKMKYAIFSPVRLSLLSYHHWCIFFLSSGSPFLTVAIAMSPTPAAGSQFGRPFIPFIEMMYTFLALYC